MASWGKVAAVLRTGLRSSRSLTGLAARRAVGPVLLGSVIGTGAVCYYRHRADIRTAAFAVHAEEQKVSH